MEAVSKSDPSTSGEQRRGASREVRGDVPPASVADPHDAAASISDVARRANVSISTVSRVVNRRAVVNPQTRARVECAIRELGYHPNAFARGLTLGRSEIVGLVLPDMHGEFYSEIIRGADAQARESGYSLVVSSTRDGDDGHSALVAIQKRTLLDGVAVMLSEPTHQVTEVLSHFRIPLVVLDDEIEGVPHDSVLIDQRFGSTALTRHILERTGARRVIFLGGPDGNVDSRARLEVCQEVLRGAGVTIAAADILHLDYEYGTAFRVACEAVRGWAGRGHVVFAANDEMAAGVVAAASAMGVRIPNDLAVVGFDDTRIARMTRPALTTVRVPMSRMGAEAVRLLCQRIVNPRAAVARISLRPELIVRESC